MARSSPRQKLNELLSAFHATDSGLIVPSRMARRERSRGRTNGVVGASYASGVPVRLPIESEPMRAISGSLYVARSLCEMALWSIEATTAVTTISRDVFMTSDGDVGSWVAKGIRNGPKEEDREPINEESAAVIRDLQQRRCGKSYVVGAMRFQQAINEMLRYGDSFVQVRFAREGLSSRASDWCVGETFYMPPLEMFVLQDEMGREAGYRTLGDRSGEETDYELLEILHFCHQQNGLYGSTPYTARLPNWESLKRAYPAVESAVIDTGAAPWLHIMPEGTSEEKRAEYEDTHANLASEGVIKNLYLMSGADLRKAANNDAGIKELIEMWLEYRRAMIPFGLPEYFFSLPNRAQAQNIAGQTALVYMRLIAYVRSLVGEQIKWLCDIEIALKLGIEHLRENPYDIVWPKWETTPTQHIEVEREAA